MKKIVLFLMLALVCSVTFAGGLSDHDQMKMYFQSAEKAWKHGDFKEAVIYCEKAFAKKIQLFDSLYFIHGLCLYHLNRLPDAKASLETYLEKAGTIDKAYYNISLNTIKEIEKSYFKACGKQWLMWTNGIDYSGCRNWVRRLGKGWRIPTSEEVLSLHRETKKTTDKDYVWTSDRGETSKTRSTASISYGSVKQLDPSYGYPWVYCIAVRDLK